MSPPNSPSAATPSAAERRDVAIAEFFEAASAILRKVEPLIDLTLAEAAAAKKRNAR